MKAARTGAPGARRADARMNRERIVAAAREVFAEDGPEASLNEIARRAGVGPGTLYRHFPNRRALAAAVVVERVEVLVAHAERLLDADSADAALAEWLAAFLAHARLHQGTGIAAMVEDADDPGADHLGVDCHRLIADAAAALLTRAQREGTARPDVASADLVQLVVGIALAAELAADPRQPERLLALVLDAVLAR
ncbi:TetR/AcrR family transcriptional regulator [Yinghuangia sp. YIM S09857]|uniref:TetR/AcrR family transcriptional regulator n=1 Tax=Yinghuangia sp. YIM S09857 TaxID=3436929 RepID=UPI003F529C00